MAEEVKKQEVQEEVQKKNKAMRWLVLGVPLLLVVAAIYLFTSPSLFGERQRDTSTVILVENTEGNSPPPLVVTKVPSAPVQPVETVPAVSPTVAPTPSPPKSPLEQASEKLSGYEIVYYRDDMKLNFTIRPENIIKLEKSTNGLSTWTATVRGAGRDGMPLIWYLFLNDDFGVVDKAKMTQSN